MTDGGDPLVHELSDFRRAAMRESVMARYQNSRIQSLKAKIGRRFESNSIARKLGFFLHHFLRDTTQTINSAFYNSLLVESPSPMHLTSPSHAIANLRALRDDRELFTTRIIDFCRSHPNYVDVITFSFLPSFYGLLQSFDRQDEFAAFVEAVSVIDRPLALQFARIIFVLPEFLAIVRQVMSQISLVWADIASEDEWSLFLDQWTAALSQLLPAVPQVVLRVASLGDDFLATSFFAEVFRTPGLFFFCHIGDGSPHFPADRWLSEFRTLLATPSPRDRDVYKDAGNCVPILASTSVVSSFDIAVLDALLRPSATPPSLPTAFNFVLLRQEHPIRQVPCDSSPALALKEFLIDGDTVHGSTNFADCLNAMAAFSPSPIASVQRIRLRLFQMQEHPVEFSEDPALTIDPDLLALADALKRCRRCERQVLEWKRTLAQWTLVDSMFQFCPVSDAEVSDMAKLCQFFESLLENWRSWFGQQGFSFVFDESLLVLRMMRSFTYDRFVTRCPSLIGWDARFAADIQGLLIDGTDILTGDLSELFRGPIALVTTAYKAKSSFVALNLVGKAIRDIGRIVGCQVREVCEDHRGFVPEVFKRAAPAAGVVSRSEYLLRCLRLLENRGIKNTFLADFGNVTIGLCSVLQLLNDLPGHDMEECAMINR
jgi:hypothetical protein